MSLDRFHKAHASRSDGYATALAELRGGRKNSHWIWYIFPQIEGLARSPTAAAYSLNDLAEACAYLLDPILGARYEEIAGAVAGQIARGIALEDLMGGTTDALKLVSSLTLFRAAAQHLAAKAPAYHQLAESWDALLQQAAARGYRPCALTLARIENETAT